MKQVEYGRNRDEDRAVAAKSRDRRKATISRPEFGNDVPGGMRISSPTEGRHLGSRKPKSLHGDGGRNGLGAPYETRCVRKRHSGGHGARQGCQRHDPASRHGEENAPWRGNTGSAEAIGSVVKRCILCDRAGDESRPRRSRNPRVAGARSECVGKQTSIGRIARRTTRQAARRTGKCALAGRSSSCR